MGRINLQSGIKVIEEVPEECGTSESYRATIVCMINAEAGTVLAVMRRNVRWGVHYMSSDYQPEDSLIQSLKMLRKQIFSWQNPWHTINPSLYLQPFLDVIRSDETDAMQSVVDAVTGCRFEVTDPASEEVVLMRILQVLLACMKSKASVMLSNQHVCTIVNTCFHIVHQAGSKSELLQRISRYTMHELIRFIFSHHPDVKNTRQALVDEVNTVKQESGGLDNDYAFGSTQIENGNGNSELGGQASSVRFLSDASTGLATIEENAIGAGSGKDALPFDSHLMTVPYGVPCMVEIFHFLCSLLNAVEHIGKGSRSNTIAFDEDVPLFALGLINSAIEVGGPSIRCQPRLLSLIQDELFSNLMQFGLSMSPLILSMVCSIVLNLYHGLRTELKLQLEAFFSFVILRLAHSRYGASYQLQEVAMEALVDFCRQKTFMMEMYANFDCDMTCNNVFEDLTNLLSKSAIPMNCPLSSIHILALDGLIAVIQGIVGRIGIGSVGSEPAPVNIDEYTSFWTVKCDNYSDPYQWVPFIRRRKHIKRRRINGGNDLPREFLSELYHSICKNEIRTTPEQGFSYPEMTPSRWIDLMHKSKRMAPYILSDSRAHLDHDMFAIMSGPTIDAISVVFDHAELEDIYQTCIDGFLAVAKISACHHLVDVLDSVVVSLCKVHDPLESIISGGICASLC
ncbi:hypothetical protein OIU84_028975 [Salix udensis]|uniref:Mon2/Sec7/BIG1-like HUS domain-containing protein n=1 Tax=Salix udensis TaxID=889485 RepID=A0AAD6KE38_9ROSI|nr:hypothetical protein OIU84_028975 [Salix udensis]